MIDIESAAPGASPVTIEAVFPASARRLFDAWTRPEQLRRWFGVDPAMLTDVQIDLREGGAWRFAMRAGEERDEVLEGRYLEIVPGERLVFSWSHQVRTPDGEIRRTPPSRVTIDFEPLGTSTRMTLEHREITTEDGRKGVRRGWRKSFAALADLVTPAG